MKGIKARHIFVATILLATIAIAGLSFTFQDDSSDGDGLTISDSKNFDLASALENAEFGDTVRMTSDGTLSRDSVVRSGVVLDTRGYAVEIMDRSTLIVEGTMTLSGNMSIGYRCSLIVSSGGMCIIEGSDITSSGSIEILGSGLMVMASSKKVTLIGDGYSYLNIDGTLNVYNASIEVRSVNVTGHLMINDASSLSISREIVIGTPPTLTSDMKNDAVINGKITLRASSTVLVYGENSFTSENIKLSSKSTTFLIRGDVYATQYTDSTSNAALNILDCSDLKDYVLLNWSDESGEKISDTDVINIGSTGYKVLGSVVEKRLYDVYLTEDESIRWFVNGEPIGSSGTVKRAYDSKITVYITLKSGTELPSIKVNGMPFENGSEYLVTENVTFTTSNAQPSSNNDLIMYLVLILIVITVFLLLVIFYVKYLKPVPQQSKRKKR